MKAVLISIRPQWCEKIATGKKTIEVRKTAPKEVPFKAYIYCTKEKYDWLYRVDNNGRGKAQSWHGKVIGEFICDYVEDFTPSEYGIRFKRFTSLHETCLTVAEMREYANGKPLYGWHISDLKIYYKPKELSEFISPAKVKQCAEYCGNGLCSALFYEELCDNVKRCGYKRITRPQQSWQYVEEL